MSTREDIEAAVKRYGAGDYIKQKDNIGAYDEYWRPIQKDNDLHLLADAYLAERAERQRRIESACCTIAAHDSFPIGKSGVPVYRPLTVNQIRDIITRHLEGDSNEG